MATKVNINAQVVRTYQPGENKYEEVINQQLNEALASGTVDRILMANGYIAQHPNEVVTLQTVQNFPSESRVQDMIDNTSFNFGPYGQKTPTILLKHNTGVKGSPKPRITDLTPGEIAVDGMGDGPKSGRPAPTIYLINHKNEVQKIDAGTVNGFKLDRDVSGGTGDGSIPNRKEIKDLINSMFTYDHANNALTITRL